MKKLSIILCLTMCLLIVGCGSKQESNVSETTEDKVETTENVDNSKETKENDIEEEKQGKDLDGDGYVQIDENGSAESGLYEDFQEMDEEDIDILALSNEYDTLSEFGDSEEDTERMKEIAKILIKKVPELKSYYDEETGLLSEEAFD